MTTSSNDIISDGTDGRGEASAGSRSSFGRSKTDPADAETVSGSNGGNSPASSEAGEAASGEEPPEPELDELTRLTGERDEYLDLARRTQAEFENFRKRAARERGEQRARVIAEVVRDLLPVVDNIDRALEAAEGADENDALLQGVRMVHVELHGYLERLGLKAIETDGARFDPALHEAIASIPVEGSESGLIHEVRQQGFQLDEIVVRPARVVVTA
ncbi:MAG: nucleotide exchange factor GrpE [Actinobacteria bacterium]|nr:nucleotide exchange factor GrpE [Actinomycetota bacterium]